MTQADAILKLADDFQEAVRTMRSGELPPISDQSIDVPVEERTWETYPANKKYMSEGLARISHAAHELSRNLTGMTEDDFYYEQDKVRDSLKKMGTELFTVRNVFVSMTQQ